MKVGPPIFPQFSDDAVRVLARTLTEYLERVSRKLDGMSYGRVAEHDTATPAPPVAGTWARGDFVRNSAPSQLGSAGSRYVVIGWTRTTNGSTNVLNTDWFEARVLTGN